MLAKSQGAITSTLLGFAVITRTAPNMNCVKLAVVSNSTLH